MLPMSGVYVKEQSSVMHAWALLYGLCCGQSHVQQGGFHLTVESYSLFLCFVFFFLLPHRTIGSKIQSEVKPILMVTLSNAFSLVSRRLHNFATGFVWFTGFCVVFDRSEWLFWRCFYDTRLKITLRLQSPDVFLLETAKFAMPWLLLLLCLAFFCLIPLRLWVLIYTVI